MTDESRPIQTRPEDSAPPPTPHQAASRHRTRARAVTAQIEAMRADIRLFFEAPDAADTPDPVAALRTMRDGLDKLAELAAGIEPAGELVAMARRYHEGAIDLGVRP